MCQQHYINCYLLNMNNIQSWHSQLKIQSLSWKTIPCTLPEIITNILHKCWRTIYTYTTHLQHTTFKHIFHSCNNQQLQNIYKSNSFSMKLNTLICTLHTGFSSSVAGEPLKIYLLSTSILQPESTLQKSGCKKILSHDKGDGVTTFFVGNVDTMFHPHFHLNLCFTMPHLNFHCDVAQSFLIPQI
jgi:hypothetical protein